MDYKEINYYADVFSGYAFSAKDLNEENGIPVLKIGNIQDKNVLKDVESYYPLELSTKLKKYLLKKDDFLIAMTGAGSVGKVGKMKQQKKEYLVNQRVAIVRPNKNVNSNFLFYFFSQNFIEEYLYIRGIGAGQPNISANDIKKIKVNFPDLQTQEKIATILKKYDKLIENNNRRITILEKMAEEIYKEWFVRFRFPGYEKIKLENGIPNTWQIKCLGDFGIIKTGKTPSTEKKENYGDYIMFVKTPDMHNNMFVTNSEENLSEIGNKSQIKKKLPANSIMVSCIGTGGVVAINAKEAHTNQQINSIVLYNDYELEWLYFTCKSLKSTIEMFGATGATMTNLSKGKFEKLKVIKPDKNIVKDFNKIVNPIFEQIKKLTYQNENLIKQRDLLLPRLMSGKLEVK